MNKSNKIRTNLPVYQLVFFMPQNRLILKHRHTLFQKFMGFTPSPVRKGERKEWKGTVKGGGEGRKRKVWVNPPLPETGSTRLPML